MNVDSRQRIDNMFSNPSSRECLRGGGVGVDGLDQRNDIPTSLEVGDESNDEIQMYMHGRGCLKRHTVGCTDDLSQPSSSAGSPMEPPHGHSPAPTSGGRTRRTGLLTVMERPPGNLLLLHAFDMFFFTCACFFSFNFNFFA